MRVALRPISEIQPYPGNPRQNDQAVDAVADSIRQFGFRQPIVVDAEGVIVIGHTRYKAALQLGLDKVPVHVARDLSPEQIKAYRIADNQTADLASWDYDLLCAEIDGLRSASVPLDQLGFSQEEIESLCGDSAKEQCQVDVAPPEDDGPRPGLMYHESSHDGLR